jgi:hypothetical protein
MRKMLAVIAAATAIAAAGSVIPTRANATGLGIGIRGSLEEIDLATPVHYGCRRVWRCTPFGCGFRSVCWAPPAYAYGAYNSYRPWPYRHWHWRHRGGW